MWEIILTSGITALIINVAWEFFESKLSFKHSKRLQIDNFYREVSGKKMHDILEKWSELIFFATDTKVEKKLKDDKYLNGLLHETYIYSSSETCKRMSNFQQYLYKNHKSDSNSQAQKEDYYDILVLVAGIVTSLKYDFTGEWVGIDDTLRTKLVDFESNRERFEVKIKEHGLHKKRS